MFRKISTAFLIIFAVGCGLYVVSEKVFADGSDACLSYNLSTGSYSNAQLTQMLTECNAESAATAAQLKAQQATSTSIAGDVALLNSLIKKAAQQISIKNQIIAQLGSQINQKQQTIETLSQKLQNENNSLSQILSNEDQIDNTTLTEMLLSDRSISDFFLDIDNYQTIDQSLQESLNTIKGIKLQTTTEKTALEAQKTQQANLKNQIQAQQVQTQAQQAAKKALLASSQSAEKTYQELLSERQAQASKISAALFNLAGVSKGIPFGNAYKYSMIASNITGVRPAFILAILKQESNLGLDQGGCYVTDPSISGAGTRAKNGELIATVMASPRDTTPFRQILSSLGLSANNTQVSCPQKSSGKYFGYGGAMGPSQFIPSTWVMFESRIESALGEAAANPWNPQDAIMATALYLHDLGAQNTSQEKSAACKYYSGQGCTGNATPYGSSVIKLEASIQADINVLIAAGQ